MSFDTQIPVLQKRQDLILYIKANIVSIRPSVCVDKNWAVPGRFFQSLPIPCGDQQGRTGQGRAARATAVGGRATIFKKNYFHYRTY